MGNANSRQNIKQAFLAQLRRTVIWKGFERLTERAGKLIGYPFWQKEHSLSEQPRTEITQSTPQSDPEEPSSTQPHSEPHQSAHPSEPEELSPKPGDIHEVNVMVDKITKAITTANPLGVSQYTPTVYKNYASYIDKMKAVYSRVAPQVESPSKPEPSTRRLSTSGPINYDEEIAMYFSSSLMVALPQSRSSESIITVASQPLVYDKNEAYASRHTSSSASISAIERTDFTPNQRAFEKDEKAMLVQLSKWDSKAVYSELRLDQSSIRVAEIQPGVPEDNIHVCMTVRRLDEVAMQYQALSYVWGNQDEQRDIFVNKVKVPIGLSLYAALQSLRHPVSPTCIWIDAICINQTSLAERSREVIKMGEIYRLASRVNVFLGASAPRVSSPIESLFQFLNRDDEIQSTSRALDEELVSLQSICDVCHLNVRDVCNGFVEMCLRPWWGRVWILQEFYLASEEPEWYWGRMHVSNTYLKRDFNLLMDVSWYLFFRKDENTNDMTALESKINKSMGAFRVQVERISTLISRRLVTHGFDTPRRLYRELLAQAGVKHDYVYGLRAIFDPVFSKVFVPDYNMHKELLFACLAVFLIQFECWGDVLWWYPSRFAAGLGQYPSWLPDFSKRIVPHELDVVPPDLAIDELEPKLLVLNHHLHAEGYVLDTMYGHRHIHESDHHKILGELWQFDHCMNHNHEFHDYFVSGAAPEDAWLKVLLDMYRNNNDKLLKHFNSAFRGRLFQSTMRPKDHSKLPQQVCECVPSWDVLRWHALRTTTSGLVAALGFEENQAEQGCLEGIFSSRMDDVFRQAFANFFIGACIFDWNHLSIWLSRFPQAKQWSWDATYWTEIGGTLPEDIEKRTKIITSAYDSYQSDISEEVLQVSWCYSFYYTYLAYVILLDCDDHDWLESIIHKLQEASIKLRVIYHSIQTPQIEVLASVVSSIATRNSHLKTVISMFAGRQLLWTNGGFRGISCPDTEVCSNKKSVVVIADGLSFPLIVRDWEEKTGDGWLAGFAHIRGVNMLHRDADKVVLPENYDKGKKRIFKFR